MKIGFYSKLAFEGIRKNKRLYIPYILACGGMVMMFYIIHYLAAMPSLDNMAGGRSTKQILGFGVWVIAVFSLIFLIYTNSFLMRRRQKEFGLYNILGMGKKNLSAVYVFETVIMFFVSMILGLVFGVALSKMAELGLVNMLNEKITYGFTFSSEVFFDTFLVFGIIYLVLLIKGLITLWRLNAVELMKSENIGEKPPRANYLLGTAGILILAGAYYIAISIQSPLLALAWFFVAVIMVIIATYLLFISGSVMLCRILQKNKKYYYKKNHFVSISSMVYRMKRNGAGLASICILSTMVLVMMLGSGSLYFGAEDSLNTRYPKDISVSVDFMPYDEKYAYTPEKSDYIISEINNVIENYGAETQNKEIYLSAGITGLLDNGKLITNKDTVNGAGVNSINNVSQIYFLELDGYNNLRGTNETLNDDEALIYCVRRTYNEPSVAINDEIVLKIKKHVDNMVGSSDAAMDIVPSVFLVVNDIRPIYEAINADFSNDEYFCRPVLHFSFDTQLKAEEEIELKEAVFERIHELNYTGECGFYSYFVESREEQRGDFYATYGGIFYLGMILSVVFILAAVLIIYYKQISEGYEDESRFAIMQKVGMTKKDIRKSINSQMLTVFSLPLLTAALHLGFAFPMVEKLLALFNLRNISLMITVLTVCVLVFGVFYSVIYKVTSNAYYKIVSGRD